MGYTVEVRRESFSDEMRQMIALRDRIGHEIHAVTGIAMAVELVAAGHARALRLEGAAGPRSPPGAGRDSQTDRARARHALAQRKRGEARRLAA